MGSKWEYGELTRILGILSELLFNLIKKALNSVWGKKM